MQKRSDSRYQKKLTIGHDENNKPIYKYFYGKTQRELNAKILEYQKGNTVDKNTITLNEWCKKWVEDSKNPNKINTYRMYKNLVNNVANNSIGKKQLQTLKPIDLQKYLNCLIQDGHYRTAQMARMFLKQVFASAEDNDLINKNIASNLKLDRQVKKQEKKVLTDDELNVLLSYDDYTLEEKAIVYLLSATGIRIGELLALHSNDFNLDKKIVTIQRNLVTNVTPSVINDFPKTNAGFRDIPLSETLLNVLTDFLPKNDYLFITKIKGLKSFHSSTTIKKIITSIKNKTGVDFHAHMLRHTFATNCAKNNMPVKTLQYIMGHEDIKVTLQIYTDFAVDFKQTADIINLFIK